MPTTAAAPRADRKPKATKGASLSARITPELRKAIEAEAERTTRSIGQVAEQWLEDARHGRASELQRLGGSPAVAEALATMAEVSRRVSEEIGDPSRDYRGVVAVKAAWRQIIHSSLARTPDPARAKQRQIRESIESLALLALKAIWSAGLDSDVYKAASGGPGASAAPQAEAPGFGGFAPSLMADALSAAIPPAAPYMGRSLLTELEAIVRDGIIAADPSVIERIEALAALDGPAAGELRLLATKATELDRLYSEGYAGQKALEEAGRLIADDYAPREPHFRLSLPTPPQHQE